MNKINALRKLSPKPQFKPNDTLVVFGEVFERGYVNGIIDEAKNMGLQIIYATVGRRDEDLNLRPLTKEELELKGHSPIINIPLEAGFDLEPDNSGLRPVDQLKEYGLTGWEEAKLNWKSLEESRTNGVRRFRTHVKNFLSEVEKLTEKSTNLIFVHTMAGGFPRARVVMPIANRVFKGTGPRFQSSQSFWQSEIGRLCEMSFNEVTAETLHHLIDLSQPLREKFAKKGGRVCYAAYGYHGNEVCVGDQYEWYSYSPYLQGYAKIRLEEICTKAFHDKISATVFNVPEILTNSSSIFLGIEVVLYPLMRALKKEGPKSKRIEQILARCESKLKEGVTLKDIDNKTQEYLTNKTVRAWPKLTGWPQHNNPEQMAFMQEYSSALIALHKNPKELMTAELSEVIFRACGKVMFHELMNPPGPVLWIGHDLVAKVTAIET